MHTYSYIPARVNSIPEGKRHAIVGLTNSNSGDYPFLLIPLDQFKFVCEVFSGDIHPSDIKPGEKTALSTNDEVIIIIDHFEIIGWGTSEAFEEVEKWVAAGQDERLRSIGAKGLVKLEPTQ